MSLRDGLLAHWTLSQTGTRSNEIGTAHATPAGGVSTVAGKLGDATGFNGSDATLMVPDSDVVSIGAGEDFTIAGWYQRNTVDDGMLVAKGDAAFEVPEYFLLFTGNYVLWELWNAENVFDIFSTPEAPHGTPHLLIAGYRSATQEMHLQVNDEAVETYVISGGVRDGDSDFHIGSVAGASSFLNGWANSLSIWDRDLTTEDRSQLWNSGAGLAFPGFGPAGTTLSAAAKRSLTKLCAHPVLGRQIAAVLETGVKTTLTSRQKDALRRVLVTRRAYNAVVMSIETGAALSTWGRDGLLAAVNHPVTAAEIADAIEALA